MSNPLAHYRRKRFFCRLTLRGSTRGGAMFGAAWLLMAHALFPLFVLAALRFAFSPYMGRFAVAAVVLASYMGRFAVAAMATTAVFLLLFIYGVVVYAGGLDGLLRRTVRNGGLRELLAAAGALLYPFSGLLLLAESIRRRRFAAVFFAVLGIALAVTAELSDPRLGVGVLLLYLAALAGMGDRRGFDWRFLWPLLLAAVVAGGLFGYELKLRREVAAECDAISRELGRSIAIDAFREREARGFPLAAEPLKSLIAGAPEVVSYDDLETAEAAKRALARYRSRHAGFVAALERFSALPVDHVAHEIPADGSLYEVEMSELKAFRAGAVYLGAVIAAEPEKKDRVRAANRALIRLREWPTRNSLIISHLVGISIESIRLKALRHPLASGKYTRSEFVELVGEPVDWEGSMRIAFGNEATMYRSVVEDLKRSAGSAGSVYHLPKLGFLKRRLPLFMEIMLLRDTRYAMRFLRRGCEVPPPGLPVEEKVKRLALDTMEIERKGYMLSGMLLPGLDLLIRQNAKPADTRRMALLAAEVMEYRRRTGELPGSLDLLPTRMISELTGRPFRLEKSAEGFRIVRDASPTVKNPGNDPTATYPVRIIGGAL